MSHNLARLRTLFGDELLTCSAEGMRPTPRAMALVDSVRLALAQIQSTVLQTEAFEPATADRVFRIGLADSIEVAVIPGLIERLQASAPGVSLRLRSTNRMSILEELDTGTLDLGIGVFNQGQTHHKRRQLHTESFLCLFSPEQLDLTPPISLQDYLRWPHVLTSLADDARGAVDEALAKRKLTRSIVMTTPGFLAVPFVVCPRHHDNAVAPCAVLLRSLQARHKPRANRSTELHHLVAVARELRSRPWASMAAPNCGRARARRAFRALKPVPRGVDNFRIGEASALQWSHHWRDVTS